MAGKLDDLKAILRAMEGVLIGFSGGVDSTFLLAVAHQTLGDRVLAVTVLSDADPPCEAEEAAQFARHLGVQHRVLPVELLDDPAFRDNPPDRCYFCKRVLFGRLKEMASREGLPWVADGSNADDVGDYRPGLRALDELGIRSPLKEVSLTKQEIRDLSRQLALPTWDKPSFACLASRFPYGTPITRTRLRQVDRAEQFLRDQGVRACRVRYHGDVARIEVPEEDLDRFLDPQFRKATTDALRNAGFLYVTLDLAGYRTGSMNEPLAAARPALAREANKER